MSAEALTRQGAARRCSPGHSRSGHRSARPTRGQEIAGASEVSGRGAVTSRDCKRKGSRRVDRHPGFTTPFTTLAGRRGARVRRLLVIMSRIVRFLDGHAESRAAAGRRLDVMAGANGGTGARHGWRWDMALSFAGAQRDYVEQVAQGAAGAGGALLLRRRRADRGVVQVPGRGAAGPIYGEQAAAVVVFVSAEYAARDWIRHERRTALARGGAGTAGVRAAGCRRGRGMVCRTGWRPRRRRMVRPQTCKVTVDPTGTSVPGGGVWAVTEPVMGSRTASVPLTLSRL